MAGRVWFGYGRPGWVGCGGSGWVKLWQAGSGQVVTGHVGLGYGRRVGRDTHDHQGGRVRL